MTRQSSQASSTCHAGGQVPFSACPRCSRISFGTLRLLADFACYYNSWRLHMTLEGAVPELIHAGQRWQRPARTAKAVPDRIERRFFPETRIPAFRLAA